MGVAGKIKDEAAPAGAATLVDGPYRPPSEAAPRKPGAALIAATLAARLADRKGRVILLTTGEARADDLGRMLVAFFGDGREVLILPPWDCLPYDHASPSRESQGRRLLVLDRLAAGDPKRQLLVLSPEAVMQRLPPVEAHLARFGLRVGEALDRDALEVFAARTGYVIDDRIDEPGEIAFLGEVIDVFPAAADRPLRIVLAHGLVQSIRWFDPISQRSEEEIEAFVLMGASELHLPDDVEREAGAEHGLATVCGPLDTIFDRAEGARIFVEADALDRCGRFLNHVREAYATAQTFSASLAGLASPAGLYLALDALASATAEAEDLTPSAEAAPTPSFAIERGPGKALARYISERQEAERRVVVCGTPPELKTLTRFLKRQGIDLPEPAADWNTVMGGEASGLFAFVADPGAGFDDPDLDLTLLTTTDILGGRVARSRNATQTLIGEPELRAGDVVIHEDHGLGVLQALERIEIEGMERDVIRLEYHGGATVLAPVEEFGRIWRYGSEASAVTLDRLGSDAWLKRRAEVSAQIDETAARLVTMASEKAEAEAAPIVPPRQAYAAFVSRFPFPESVDQASAIGEVLSDLASGKPMDRLICGDVGFGKTEAALRAAAAVALSGRQVAVVAPTTVLARQHFENFRRRFSDTGIKVAHLSRLVEGSEAQAVKAGLQDGTVRIVVGTQALASDAIIFDDLGLVILDEEQRFGSKMKDALRASSTHFLSMTATPIPRTLQTALIGLVDVSVIASPPARRRPIRTVTTDLDKASLRTALLREKRRRGQSFVVCPRIEDLEPMRTLLGEIVPELTLTVAHGKMPAADVDEAMVDFADGRNDILLATNIIESGLDVPRANTIVVWRPDRFGLAQLHQLRGRVGRGRAQGFAYLLTDPDDEIGEATRARLGVLEAFDRLGSGFAISARDLDLRGGGDLVGDEQAGHMKKIGAALYQSVLERAVRSARGEAMPPLVAPPTISASAFLSDDYIPDATMRINLYARLARASSAAAVDALEDEVGDRFGPMPAAVANLLSTARLGALAAEAGVARVARGPKGTAFSIAPDWLELVKERLPEADGRRWIDDRLIFDTEGDQPHDDRFVAAVLADLSG